MAGKVTQLAPRTKAQPAKGGRPTKLTPEVTAAIVAAVREGAPMYLAAEAAGVSRRAIIQWERKGEAEPDGIYGVFVRDIKKARAEAVAQHIATVLKASEKSWQAAAWWLERQHPEEFGRREAFTVASASDVHIVVEHVKDWHARDIIEVQDPAKR